MATPPLSEERLSIATFPAPTPHWIYVVDDAFYNQTDARVHWFDGDSYRRLGQIDAGFPPGVTFSPTAKARLLPRPIGREEATGNARM